MLNLLYHKCKPLIMIAGYSSIFKKILKNYNLREKRLEEDIFTEVENLMMK